MAAHLRIGCRLRRLPDSNMGNCQIQKGRLPVLNKGRLPDSNPAFNLSGSGHRSSNNLNADSDP
jgi:hypothetical protein